LKSFPVGDRLYPTSLRTAITAAWTAATFGLLAPFPFPDDEKQKFSEEVSNLIQDEPFLNDFSNQIGEPLEDESEDTFVDRASNALRQMLYDKFGLKN